LNISSAAAVTMRWRVSRPLGVNFAGLVLAALMLPSYQKVDLTIHFCFSILDPATQSLRLEMIMKLEAKIAVVTGSTSGIGAATPRASARGMAAEICEMITPSSGKAIGLRAERLARSRDRETRRDL
jgi:hypothetical protein